MVSIYKNKDLKNIIKETIIEIAETVTMTMGPNGSTVILTNKFEGPYATKDGVSVIKAIGYKDPVKNAIAKMVLEVAEETLKIAGDGTTTAICLATSLILEGYHLIDKGFSFTSLTEELNVLQEHVLSHLEEMSEALEKEDIVDVATISANGDEVMGNIIQLAFNHSSNVKIEEGIDIKDKVETINGMILNTGYLDPAFVNVPEKDTIEYNNPTIILVDGMLSDLKIIAKPLQNPEGPVIIIADNVTPNIQNILRDNYNRGAISVALMKSPGFGGHRKSLMNDLKCFIDCQPNTTWGKVDSIIIGKETTTITKKRLSKESLGHLINLKKRLKLKKEDDLLEQRISNLEGKLSIIKIGGYTPAEVKEKYDRYDDAVKAVSCAIEEGILPGGGSALYQISNRLEECNVKTNFNKCLKEPLNIINKNSEYTLFIENRDMLQEKIFDPTKVTKTAFINAVSIAKILLNTNAIVIDRSLWI